MSPTRPEEPLPNVSPASQAVAVQAAQPAAAAEQEIDVWWGSYSGRSMIPTFILCAVVSTTIGLVAGWLWDEQRAHPQLMWHSAVSLIVLVWLFPLLLCGYRTVAFNYRLTTRRLLRDRGFRHPPSNGEVELERVTAVRVQYTALGRWVGVGRIVVDAEGAPPLALNGVYEPERVADRIRGGAQRARERNGDARTV